MEHFGIKFDDCANPTEADVDKFWDVINNTKHVKRCVENDGTLLFNMNVEDPNQQRGMKIKLTLYCSRFTIACDTP